MIYKVRTKSLTHLILESLYYRNLPSDVKKRYFNQLRGWKGELQFDVLLEKLHCNCLILNDLMIKYDGKTFQIDSLIISGNTIYLYEVKNYSGSYEYRDDSLRSQTEYEIDNPLERLHRRKTAIYNLTRKMGYRFNIKSFVVFINPEFYLYDLPRDKPFIFSGQLPSHFQSLEKEHGVITESHKKLAQKLCDMHIENYRAKGLPAYNYSDLQKGILCPNCFSFEHNDTRQTRCCKKCGYKESITEAIRRSVEEVRGLFPDMVITSSLIYDWCGKVYPQHKIQRVLRDNYHLNGAHRNAFYD